MSRPSIRVMALLLAAAALPASAHADETLWARLEAGRQIVLLRHGATTPGVGDPPGFRLGDCPTQRNLNEAGREEARRIGAAFRARSIPVERVLSSQWCRCLETAELAFGRPEPWEPLNSLVPDRARQTERSQAFRRMAGEPRAGNVVLVTHGVNILAFVGVRPAMGEMVIVAPTGDGGFTVAGRLPAPPADERKGRR